MENSAPILADQPSNLDHLDFEPYCTTLRDIIDDPLTQTPLTIGVFGGWGTGKTTLLQMLLHKVKDKHLTVWFNAWKYDKEDVLWRALLLRVVAAIRAALPSDDKKAREKLSELEEILYQAIEREELGNFEFDWREFLKEGVKTGTQVAMATIPGLNLAAKVVEELQKSAATEGPGGLLKAFKQARTQVRLAQIDSLDQFEQQFGSLIQEYVTSLNRRLVIFIDDLDRCLPQKAIEILEAIKLFFDVPGCIFVLGVDRDVIASGIKLKYRDLAGEIDGKEYLEKIIQLPFDLPLLEVQDVQTYVKGLAPNLLTERCEKVFASGLIEPNPRQIKRTINTFLFLSRLAAARAHRLGRLEAVRLAKIVVIQHSYPQLYSLLRREPRLIAELENYYCALQNAQESKERASVTPVLTDRLQEFANLLELRNLLTLFEKDKDACFASLRPLEIRPYFTLVRSIAIDEPTLEKLGSLEPEMVTIPAGAFVMGTHNDEIHWLAENTEWGKDVKKNYFKDEQPQHEVTLAGYQIGRYPVTNMEYQVFVQSSGYQPPMHWNGNIAQEEISDHPVTFVSFNDATAYCEWLAKSTGKPYRLPTEAEWEKAARGTDRRIYPWGTEFDANYCNLEESGIQGTTPIGQYAPNGDSPYGCTDMCGNVWEWCSDFYAEKYYQESPFKNPMGPPQGAWRVARGASWFSNQRRGRCAARNQFEPGSRHNHLGFRVALTTSPSETP